MIQIYLKSIHCHEETDGLLEGPDEPYVLVTSVDLASKAPAFDVTLYEFRDVEEGETHEAPGPSQSFWGVNGAPAPLVDPGSAIFVATLMENDDGNQSALRGLVKGIASSSLLGTLSATRADRIAALIRDIDSTTGTPIGFPNLDQEIGGSQELAFTRTELARVESGGIVSKSLNFQGDGGRYELTFAAKKAFPAVAANPVDRWVFLMGDRIVVITNDGRVYAHQVTGSAIKPAYQLAGPAVAANPVDRWVLPEGDRIVVITNDGRVYAHQVTATGNTINPAYQLT
ncbi:hypothetical protein [Kitasatospora sp. NPDC057015]|uniref:hypothetical protein n=1 Tax=Kitasatospora sp. NPDC057015 TaxID=3346001 RepID=UPI00363306C8